MNLQEIEERIATLDLSGGFGLIYDLLRAYGIPKASISRLRSGSYDRSDRNDEHLWRGKLYYRYVTNGEDPYVVIDDASKNPEITRERPRFLVVRDETRLLAVDTRNGQTLDIEAEDLADHAAFFLPWAGIEKAHLETTSYADIKAAEKMARLYDEIVKHNELSAPSDVHELNVFFSRLLFCFFAEDTGVFQKGSFTNALASLTTDSGDDTARFLDELFEVLDLSDGRRGGVPSHFKVFGYVNGKLFARRSSAPHFSAKARRLILDCGTLNWSQINPDIFGSMIQAVVHPSQREGLGMHYTSVENIMKVIRPLFLDELHAAFESVVDDVRGLDRLIERISSIKIFDPACGSGNFLVIAYKELRRLEHRILQRIVELEPHRLGMFSLSAIRLENFYGIEIDDFAHEIAILSLWLAKHQMNVEFQELFGIEIDLIPLKDTGNVVCENAARVRWEEVCRVQDGDEVYLLSNPPYLGARLQTSDQKADIQDLPGVGDLSNNLDYVSIWFLLGAQFVSEFGAKAGFVATSSVCQGEQVSLLWPRVYELGAEISFGVQSFRWSNSAKHNAGVSCVIVGLSADPQEKHALYNGDYRQTVSSVSPYLTPNHRVIVHRAPEPISPRPELTFGSMPNDGGHLLLSPLEFSEMITRYPEASRFIKRFVGADEFIKGRERFVLWIPDDEISDAMAIPAIAERVQRVAAYRAASKRAATRKLAEAPHRFGEIRHRDTASIIIPNHSSERREYIPMGFLDKHSIISNAANVLYDAQPWIFGLIQSRMHMVWIKAVAGRLESRVRYSAELCYNPFPLPQLSSSQREQLDQQVFAVLEAREAFADQTISELYDPSSMPKILREAHAQLDQSVESFYRTSPFESDDDRLMALFQMYEAETLSSSEVSANA